MGIREERDRVIEKSKALDKQIQEYNGLKDRLNEE